MSNENNNNTTLVVLGLLGFLAILVMGKFILDNNNKVCGPECHEREINSHHRPVQPRPHVDVQPRAYTPCPEYHNKSEFWLGYNDGWNGMPARMRCPEYIRGYDIGLYDRRMNQKDYYNRYYPPGFTIRVPGMNINIR